MPTPDGKVHFPNCPCPTCRPRREPVVGSVVFGPTATVTSMLPVTISLDRDELSVDQLKDAVQFAFNRGAYICPLAGKEKPPDHAIHCQSCRIRKALAGERYLKPEDA